MRKVSGARELFAIALLSSIASFFAPTDASAYGRSLRRGCEFVVITDDNDPDMVCIWDNDKLQKCTTDMNDTAVVLAKQHCRELEYVGGSEEPAPLE